MMFFKCKHPFAQLVVDRATTLDSVDRDFETQTHHLACNKCGQTLGLKFVTLVGTAANFLNRKGE
jgi:Fe2+ or Zn2+ uptake regulation protein